jgi:ADP-ribose 1''-phosphate phosphatase
MIYQQHIANPGDILVIEDRQPIACLYTSRNYGRYVDSVEQILNSTELALDKLGDYFRNQDVVISSPKINAGLFRVPWERTEALIELFLLKNPNIKWNIYCL